MSIFNYPTFACDDNHFQGKKEQIEKLNEIENLVKQAIKEKTEEIDRLKKENRQLKENIKGWTNLCKIQQELLLASKELDSIYKEFEL